MRCDSVSGARQSTDLESAPLLRGERQSLSLVEPGAELLNHSSCMGLRGGFSLSHGRQLAKPQMYTLLHLHNLQDSNERSDPSHSRFPQGMLIAVCRFVST